mgnify:CR=1 FL=1
MKLSVFPDRWEMNSPFVISTGTFHHIDTITVCINADGVCGKGEALGVDYHDETFDSMRDQVESIRGEIEAGIGTTELQQLLPPGGARNAVDCAIHDLQSKTSGVRAWQRLGTPCEPVTTVYTLSLDSPGNMASEARAHAGFPVLKLKLNNEQVEQSVHAIRKARPDAELVIDANGSWSIDFLNAVADDLLECRIAMVEQPLPVGGDAGLRGFKYPITLCADESCQSMADLPAIAERYNMVNIKLDKCGGLTEALGMANWCRERGIPLMVGNMLGSSLAMAPAFLVAQYCRFVDLDGPLWQKTDRRHPMEFNGAVIQPPARALWG